MGNCKTCAFWHYSKDLSGGECRIRAPIAVDMWYDGVLLGRQFPITHEEDSCHEHHPGTGALYPAIGDDYFRNAILDLLEKIASRS